MEFSKVKYGRDMEGEGLAPDILFFSSLGVHKLKVTNSLNSEGMLLNLNLSFVVKVLRK